jgi:Sec-independent protein translocase protein TatA
VGFGTQILFLVALGLLVLGPKQAHALLRQVARYKADFDRATRSIKAQITSELDAPHAAQSHHKNPGA